MALNALLLPAVTIIGGLIFSVFASIVFLIAEVILIFTFLALVYSENEDERKIPREMLDWIAEQTIPTMDYIVREWILKIAYYITIQFQGAALSFHSEEHKFYFFATVSPLIMLFQLILWFPLALTMPLFLTVMAIDYT